METKNSPIDPISVVSPRAITERQREVARLLAGGLTNSEIAAELDITLDGVKFHVSALLSRLGLRRREEVAEWYRAHFGPVARLRGQLRRFAALSAAGWLGTGAVVGGVILAAVFVLVARDGALGRGAGAYPAFVQEWEVSSADQETFYATLDWESCEEWTFASRDAAGASLGAVYSDGKRNDGACHIPGVWFLPINSYRENADPRDVEISPYVYERRWLRSCDQTVESTPTEGLPVDFCADLTDTFDDLVRVEFHPGTEIPMRYVQYVEGVVTEEYRATSLSIR